MTNYMHQSLEKPALVSLALKIVQSNHITIDDNKKKYRCHHKICDRSFKSESALLVRYQSGARSNARSLSQNLSALLHTISNIFPRRIVELRSTTNIGVTSVDGCSATNKLSRNISTHVHLTTDANLARRPSRMDRSSIHAELLATSTD